MVSSSLRAQGTHLRVARLAWGKGLALLAVVGLVSVLAVVQPAWAQEETTRGRIAGLVHDKDGGPITDAKVQIISQQWDVHYDLTTDTNGHYESTWLQQGPYQVRIEGRNFVVDHFVAEVKVGQVTNGDRTLSPINPGSPAITSRVDVEAVADLPIDGQDALNVAKFEPEVLPQDAGRLEASKTGNFAAAIDKISGLDSRYTLDGVELNDETHGAATQNVALGSIGELNVVRAARDVSLGQSSSGAVLLTTRSGGDNYHGDVFGFFRTSALGFAGEAGKLDPHYQRSDFGGRVGGALIQDKLFFFVDAEHVHQDAKQAVIVPAPLQALTGQFSAPYRNTSGSGRLDWNHSENLHGFYRFAYNLNSSVDDFGQGYAVYDNRSHSPSNAVGVDYTRGNMQHSFRFGYLHYGNSVQDAGQRPSVPGLAGINLRFSDLNGGAVQFGASPFAPQKTLQNNLEVRYDGVRNHPQHTLRFGGSLNRITTGGLANAYGLAPQVTSAVGTSIDSNVADYPLLAANLSNGQSFATERSGFGFPHGGQSDTRAQAYLTGAYRLYPNLTLTWGVHYVRDTGRTNSDLSSIPCSAIVAALPSTTLPCTGKAGLLNQFGGGLGLPVSQPSLNFGPQFGIAWDPYHNGRMVIRGGAGWFYDSSLFSNAALDRPARLSQGAYAGKNVLNCPLGAAPGTVAVYFPTASGLSQAQTSIDGLDLATQVCGRPVGTVAGAITDLQTAYQQSLALTGSANPYFVGRTLSVSNAVNGLAAFEPDNRSPRSYQMNIGLQRETWRGGMITLDYVRNVSQRFLMINDNNHVGDWNYLQKNSNGVPTAALNAVTKTVLEKAPACLAGIPLPVSAGAISQNAIACYIASVPGASINDFAANGLDSSVAYLGGMPASIARNGSPDTGAAFAGVNPLVGQGSFLAPIGQAVYNGFQASAKQNLSQPFFAFRAETFQVSYSLSKFVTSGGDSFSGVTVARDFEQGALYKGPSPLDRRHQISLAGALESRWGPRLLFAGRFASPAPTILSLATPSGDPATTPGEIYRTDFQGHGNPGDPFPPRTTVGSFDPPTGSGLYTAISKYNATKAGALTPQGRELVTAQIITPSQLATLHGTQPFVVLPPLNQVTNPWFKSFDTALTWPLKVRESIVIEPRVSMFNVFNLANFAPLSGQLTYYFPGPSQPLSGGVGSANGTPSGAARDVLRTSFGTGVYNAGAPRAMEFGVKITF